MSFFALSGLINGITSTVLGLFILSRIKTLKDTLRIAYALFCFSISVWSYFYFAWQIADNELRALMYCRGLMAGALFIPVFYLHYILELIGISLEKRRVIKLAYMFAVVSLAACFSPYFIPGVEEKTVFRFWPNAGILFHPFFAIWISIVLYGVTLIVKSYKTATGFKRNQLKYLLLATAIGWGGGATNYPLWYDIPILPYGNILASIYIIITSYAIFRHQLMDIRIAVTRAGIFLFVYILVLGIPFLLGYRYGLWKQAAWVTLFLATLGPFVYTCFRRHAEGVIFREQHRYQEILRRLSATMTLIKDLERLLKVIVYKVARAVKVDFACIYLAEEEKGRFIQKYPYTVKGFFPDFPRELPLEAPLIKYLQDRRRPLFAEEIDRDMDGKFNIRCGLIVPSFVRNKPLGFLVLGPKASGAIYTQDDITVFGMLANQTALAIENTEFIEESQRSQAQLFAAERMRSMGVMASGMSHQINNRFHAIMLATSDTIDTIKLTNFERSTKSELKKIFEDISYALNRIQDNAKHGGKIINDFLDFSQPRQLKQAGEFDPREAIERAVEMARIRAVVTVETIEKHIENGLPRIEGDPALFQDALFNLIDNAMDALKVKQGAIARNELQGFNDYEGKIIIRMFKSDPHITIQIQDNGIGMDEERKKHIFLPFYTTKATTQKGSGLGLFAIQKIIAAHKGRIGVSSEYGQGTLFTINLPMAAKTGGDLFS